MKSSKPEARAPRALLVEAAADRAYICTCYGNTEVSARADSSVRETIRSLHHEAPRYVIGGPAPRIEKAPARNHTDAELILLEELVGREPPFVGQFPESSY
jgi:hypothetical protein